MKKWECARCGQRFRKDSALASHCRQKHGLALEEIGRAVRDGPEGTRRQPLQEDRGRWFFYRPSVRSKARAKGEPFPNNDRPTRPSFHRNKRKKLQKRQKQARRTMRAS